MKSKFLSFFSSNRAQNLGRKNKKNERALPKTKVSIFGHGSIFGAEGEKFPKIFLEF